MPSAMADWSLVVQTGPLAGNTLEIPRERMSLGRDASCDVRVDDPKASRIHCYLEVENGELYFRDNKSTNGSTVNGQTTSRAKLRPGDVIQFGATEIVVQEREDYQTIVFHSGGTSVTTKVKTDVSDDPLTSKFTQIFNYYKENAPEVDQKEKAELAKAHRLVTSLKSFYVVTKRMSQLLPLNELLEVVSLGLFEVFPGAENLVILLQDEEKGRPVPRHSQNRGGEKNPRVSISNTVLSEAIESRSTIVANDLHQDSRFSASESIVGLNLKSVICAPLVIGDRILGALYLDNRQQNVNFDQMDAEIVSAFANQAAITLDNARLCDDLQESYHQMLQALVRAIEAKDPYTMGHTQRVKEYTLGIAREFGFDRDHMRRIGMAAELHDIGKIGVKERIINKPGGLTDTEYEDIKLHVEMGEKILKPITYLRDLLPWIRGHHEKWDGSGYPDGLKGEDCPLEARILAAADAFDAMTSQRSYNKPFTFEEAMERIRKTSGKHFDPKIVDAVESFLRKTGTGVGTRKVEGGPI